MPRYFHPAKPNEIQVDLDTPESLALFKRQIKFLEKAFIVGVYRWTLRKSSTKGHYHAAVILYNDLPIMHRIALALCLGDDPVRGLLNYGRAFLRDPYPMLFFESFPSEYKCKCGNTGKNRCECLVKLQNSKAFFKKSSAPATKSKRQGNKGSAR